MRAERGIAEWNGKETRGAMVPGAFFCLEMGEFAEIF